MAETERKEERRWNLFQLKNVESKTREWNERKSTLKMEPIESLTGNKDSLWLKSERKGTTKKKERKDKYTEQYKKIIMGVTSK